MDKAQIRAEAVKVLQSVSGYSYSEEALDAAIKAGIPEGAQIMNQNGLVVTRESDQAVGRLNGKVVNTMSLDGDFADKALVMYAVTMARIGSGTGLRA
jgi:hypothetical protein